MRISNLIKHSSTDIRNLNDSATIYDAAELIFTEGASSVLITNKINQSIGIVTEQEVVLAIKTHKQDILNKRVTEIMNIDLLACEPDEPIEEAVRVMGKYKIRSLPVITVGGNISGFIDINSVAKAQLSNIIKRWG